NAELEARHDVRFTIEAKSCQPSAVSHQQNSTPARSRTRNVSLGPRHDVRFTTRASSKRKARESNPPLRRRRTALAERPGQPVSGYHPFSVDLPGVEPGSPACRAGIVPLDHRPMRFLTSDA